MRLPSVLDAAVRYLVLTAVGVLLLIVVPGGAFGTTPVYRFLDNPGPTRANLIGLAVLLAAWAYFVIVVVCLHAARRRDLVIRLALVADVVVLAGCAAASVVRLDAVSLGLAGLAVVIQLAIAARAGGVGVRSADSHLRPVATLP